VLRARCYNSVIFTNPRSIMLPTFSPCCASPQIADTGSTVVVIVDERAGDVLPSQTLTVYRCAECSGTFAAVIEPPVVLTDADVVFTRAA
jgi:hypothetical protein